jgi:hypothetical protein
MQNTVNQPFLAKRSKYARWGSYVGMGALVVGLFSMSQSILISYAFLLVGVLAASFGSYMASHYVREPRADQALEHALDGLDKRYALYNYFFPSNHVLASHQGLIVLMVRAQEGVINYQNGHWQHKAGWKKLLQLLGEPGLGKPDQELAHEMALVKKWVDEALPEKETPVRGILVFTHPKAEVHADTAPLPAMPLAALADFLKEGCKGETTLTTAMQKELRRALDEAAQ